MNKLLIGLVAVPFLAGVAMAGQPMPLTDAQMDKVTAGIELEVFNGVANILEITAFEPPATNGILVEFPTIPGHVEDPGIGLGRLYQINPCCTVTVGS
jgi:hypothetical protein